MFTNLDDPNQPYSCNQWGNRHVQWGDEDAIITADSGYTLFTDRLHYDNQYKLITSNDSVTFTTTFNDTMYGIGFESDVDLTHSKILKPHGFYQGREEDE